jgi:hypothetical protein
LNDGRIDYFQSFSHSVIQSFSHSVIQSFSHSVIQSFSHSPDSFAPALRRPKNWQQSGGITLPQVPRIYDTAGIGSTADGVSKHALDTSALGGSQVTESEVIGKSQGEVF